jgi:hypothetical protein
MRHEQGFVASGFGTRAEPGSHHQDPKMETAGAGAVPVQVL